ncbi:MAG: hypothetical protein R6V35_03635 [Candidatus Nanohaloarchaea archaeon]
MDYEVHKSAVEEFQSLPDKFSKVIRSAVESRKSRDNPITEQRGTGIAYDNHGEPIHYFKVEEKGLNYRVFFNIKNQKVILLGARPRDDDTYLNLREFTRKI